MVIDGETKHEKSITRNEGEGMLKRAIDNIDPNDPEHIRLMQRPADVKEDMIDMGARKRVSAVLNSKAFKADLEQIIIEQLSEGHEYPSDLLALHRLSDILRQQSVSTGMYSRKGNFASKSLGNFIMPINDIRGTEYSYISAHEKSLRCKLASLCHLIDMVNINQGGIQNLISVRIDNEHEHFLINPYGLLLSEVTASSLLKINLQSQILDPGSTHLYCVPNTTFLIHGSLHALRPDIRCVIHCKSPSVLAMSNTKTNTNDNHTSYLLPISSESLICHEVMGSRALDINKLLEYGCQLLNHPKMVDKNVNELENNEDNKLYKALEETKEKILRDIGPRNKIMVLENQGLLACGSTIEEAFYYAQLVTRACETQVSTLACLGGDFTRLKLINNAPSIKGNFIPYNKDGLETTSITLTLSNANYNNGNKSNNIDEMKMQKDSNIKATFGPGELEFEAYMRRLDNMGYKTGYPYRMGPTQVWKEKRNTRKSYEDIEYPPAAHSSALDTETESSMMSDTDRLFRFGDIKKRLEKKHWLNSPNAYARVEISEVGTNQPKKITKWVPVENGIQTIIPEQPDQFIPVGTNKSEFRKLHQEIKDYRRSDKIDAGPQSNLVGSTDGTTWDENANSKLQDLSNKSSGTTYGDQVIILGAASKGIIDRSHQHNRQAFAHEYQKNPFDHMTDEVMIMRGDVNGNQSYHGINPHTNAPYYTYYNTANNSDSMMMPNDYTNSSDVRMYNNDPNRNLTLEDHLHDFMKISSGPGTTSTDATANNSIILSSPSQSFNNTTLNNTNDMSSRIITGSDELEQQPNKAGGGGNGSIKKKKSSMGGFRTPSFLKRKKSKERQHGTSNSSTGNNPNTSMIVNTSFTPSAVSHEDTSLMSVGTDNPSILYGGRIENESNINYSPYNTTNINNVSPPASNFNSNNNNNNNCINSNGYNNILHSTTAVALNESVNPYNDNFYSGDNHHRNQNNSKSSVSNSSSPSKRNGLKTPTQGSVSNAGTPIRCGPTQLHSNVNSPSRIMLNSPKDTAV